MSKCELCKAAANIYCDSDLALLCWSCDARVHSANFLVARHFRNLLCHLCQSPTTWNASGSSLSPGMSICIRCDHRTKVRRVRGRENEDIESENEYCIEEVIDENGDEDELITTYTTDDDDDGENQVAPWSDVPPPPPPLPSTVLSLSSSQGSSRRFWNCDPADSLKRMRGNNPDLKSDDDDDDYASGMSELSSTSRALKVQRVDTYEQEESGSKSAGTMTESVIEEQKVLLKVAGEEEPPRP